MPVHDWTRVPAGTFHYFHQRWIQALGDALNTGGLPPGYFAMTEVDAQEPIPGALALKVQIRSRRWSATAATWMPWRW